jgi:hypothetical protein
MTLVAGVPPVGVIVEVVVQKFNCVWSRYGAADSTCAATDELVWQPFVKLEPAMISTII